MKVKKTVKKQKLDPFDEEEQDREERLSIRNEEENMMDILLSGTTATLIIQTQKKIYIGWVGDSLVAL
jgi:serine/threonine protein phosphatase PrpC|tara:strand:- start:89 stop:292 length:204 start_codon:yes stop_codon:yes gene_type:complete